MTLLVGTLIGVVLAPLVVGIVLWNWKPRE